MLKRGYIVWCLLGSVVSVVNGLWMLLAPASWYTSFPGGISDTGPLNAHFVQDIGITYIGVGAAFAWCAVFVERARVVHLVLTAYLWGHALLHVTALMTGRLPTTHWLIDAPAVFCPAVVMSILALPPVWRGVASERASSGPAYSTIPDR